MIMLGKYKQGEVWMEGAGNLPCPELCRQNKYPVKDGYLTPANNQFLALSPTTKYSIMPAKGERIVVTYVLLKPEHIASYQPTLPSQQEGVSSSSICLPCSQAFDQERPRSV